MREFARCGFPAGDIFSNVFVSLNATAMVHDVLSGFHGLGKLGSHQGLEPGAPAGQRTFAGIK